MALDKCGGGGGGDGGGEIWSEYIHSSAKEAIIIICSTLAVFFNLEHVLSEPMWLWFHIIDPYQHLIQFSAGPV